MRMRLTQGIPGAWARKEDVALMSERRPPMNEQLKARLKKNGDLEIYRPNSIYILPISGKGEAISLRIIVAKYQDWLMLEPYNRPLLNLAISGIEMSDE